MKTFSAVAVLLAALALATFLVVQQDGQNWSRQRGMSVAMAAHDLEALFFVQRRPELEWLAAQPAVRRYLFRPARSDPAVVSLLTQSAGLLGLEVVYLADPFGRVIAASSEEFVGTDVSGREYFRKGMAGLPAYGLIDEGAHTRDLYASAPVYYESQIVGIAVFRTSSEALDQWQRNFRGLILLGPDGKVFSSWDPRFPEGADWSGSPDTKIFHDNVWYRSVRYPLTVVPGYSLTSLSPETFPWAAVVAVDALVLLLALTVFLVWNGRRLTAMRREESRDRRKQEMMLSHLLEGIAVFDADTKLVWANPGFERLWPAESAPRRLEDLWDEAEPGPWKDVLDGRRASVVFESALRGAQGWVPVSAGLIAAEGQFLLSILDGSERYRSDQLLRQSQKLTILGQLSGGIAHDLNNMLGVLMGMADLVKMALPRRDPLHESVDLIISTLGRAAGLSEKMLNFARQTPMARVRFDGAAVLRELRFLSRTALPEGTEADIEVPEQPVYLEGDENLLLSAFLNLILNAGEAMNGGTVVVRCVIEPSQLIVSVEDSGAGMDSETRARIFEPFFTTKHRSHGTGLGLSLVKRTVLEHRGSIEVDSSPGKGTRVIVTLPRLSDASGDPARE